MATVRRRYNIFGKAELGNVEPQAKVVLLILVTARYSCADLKFCEDDACMKNKIQMSSDSQIQ